MSTTTQGISHLVQDINDYWDERSQSYSNGVVGELADTRKDIWRDALYQVAGQVLEQARQEGRIPRACDLGCGPGFFSILLSDMGFQVDAVDASGGMIAQARHNVNSQARPGSVSLHVSDLLALPFADGAFDLCVSRNVTWLMRDPEAAYAEWLRVLHPGGKLVAYDANWYRYLVDPDVDAARRRDQEANVLEGWDEDAQATSDEERRCEDLARNLPLTAIPRPAWDLKTLSDLGVSTCWADTDAWRRVWTASEQRYYASSPMFMVEATK